jgi:glucose/arabinose dehydrogenase
MRCTPIRIVIAAAVIGVGLPAALALTPSCASDNGGIKLPPGFCAALVADDLGATTKGASTRHVTVAQNGDLYITVQARNGVGGGVWGLRDIDHDGTYKTRVKFGGGNGTGSSTGVAIHNGYLWVAQPNAVVRYKLTPGELKPAGDAEVVVSDLPGVQQHGDKGIAFDDKGSFYVNIGPPTNSCQVKDRTKGSPGQDPCPVLKEHGGVWKFDDSKVGMKLSDGTRFATGMRQSMAMAWHDNALYLAMNNRDQLDVLFPQYFTPEDNATLPAEPLLRAVQGSDFGWPYCFFDYKQQKLVLAPEYGGDGKQVGRCTQFTPPVASFPAHWAPMQLTFYEAKAFPSHYRGGIFIAFHGSWNRAPLPMDGYYVVFQPFAHNKPSGKFEIFASGFMGHDTIMNPTDAVARANGVAVAPDGTLFITDSVKGKLWHVFYTGKR